MEKVLRKKGRLDHKGKSRKGIVRDGWRQCLVCGGTLRRSMDGPRSYLPRRVSVRTQTKQRDDSSFTNNLLSRQPSYCTPFLEISVWFDSQVFRVRGVDILPLKLLIFSLTHRHVNSSIRDLSLVDVSWGSRRTSMN